MRTPLPYYGSKVSMAKKIVAALPPHEEYLEPFCGAAAVFFEKPRADREILSDLNPWPLAALRAVRDRPDDLLDALPRELGQDDWRESVIKVRNDDLTDDDVRDAVTMISAWQSAFNSSPWSGARSDRMCQQYANAWKKGLFEQRVRSGAERLRGVHIMRKDAISLLGIEYPTDQHYEFRNLPLVFCDPPYMRMEHGGGSRGAAYGGYGKYEPPDRKWHERFLNSVSAISKIGVQFVITSGKDELYEQVLGAELGFGFLGGFGLEGRGPGRGGTGTAKHLIWASSTSALM